MLAFPPGSRAVDFALPTSYPVGNSPSAIVVGDFNGDGKPDLAVGNLGSSDISILTNNGGGTFKPAVTSPAGTPPQVIAGGDFNGDGKLDLVVINSGNAPGTTGFVFLLLGNGDGTFQTPAQIQADQFPASVAVADFNGDSKPDLVLGDASTGAVTILLGKGDGTFQGMSAVTPGASGAVAALAVGDFDGDHKMDLVAAVSTGSVVMLLGNGDGSFHAPAVIATNSTSQHLLAADFNGDGKLDLALRARDLLPRNCRFFCIASERVTLFTGTGSGTFNARTPVFSAIGFSAGNLGAGDFNADGKPDLIAPRLGSGLVFLGHGDGTFISVPPAWTGVGPFVAVADLNADHAPDLVVSDNVSNVVVFLNTSPTSGADLAVTAPGSVDVVIGGGNLSFTATAFNEGPQDATGVTFKETLPASFTLISAQPSQGTCSGTTTITCTLGALADPSSAAVDFTIKPTTAGTFTDGLQVTGTQADLNSKNNSTSMTITAVLPADVAVSGAASKNLATVGDNVTFTITVTNHGPAAATNVVLTDSLSDALPVTALTISQGTCVAQITCAVGTLAPGASAVLKFGVKMATAEFFNHILNVTADQPDLVGDNNNATITVAVNPADLAVTQTASSISVSAGTRVTFTLMVTNKGPAAASNVMLIDGLPGGETPAAATTSQGTCTAAAGGQITCTLGSLAASATATVTIPVTFTDVGQWTNGVNVSATEPDQDSSNNSPSLNVDVVEAADFVVTPASPGLSMQRGASGTDVLTLTSLGGFSGAVSLVCSVSGPAPVPSCTVSPSSVTPGPNPVTATLTLTTLAAALEPSRSPELKGLFYAAWLPLPGIALIGIGLTSGKSRKRCLASLLCVLALAVLALQPACGKGGNNTVQTQTQPKIYTVTVTASSGAISKSTQIQLTVQ